MFKNGCDGLTINHDRYLIGGLRDMDQKPFSVQRWVELSCHENPSSAVDSLSDLTLCRAFRCAPQKYLSWYLRGLAMPWPRNVLGWGLRLRGLELGMGSQGMLCESTPGAGISERIESAGCRVGTCPHVVVTRGAHPAFKPVNEGNPSHLRRGDGGPSSNMLAIPLHVTTTRLSGS